MDIYGQALIDCFYNRLNGQVLLNNNYGTPEEMPMEVFFRDEDEMPELERIALSLCKGKILDVGAGAGSHALILQANGYTVTALEISAFACHIMTNRGVQRVINEDIFSYQDEKFDSILLLMNGIGLVQNLEGFVKFLEHTRDLLNSGGRLIFDSSDISYLYEGLDLPKKHYYGQISYQYQYSNQTGDWFNWLYIDQNTLASICSDNGWLAEIVFEDEHDQYLAVLTLSC